MKTPIALAVLALAIVVSGCGGGDQILQVAAALAAEKAGEAQQGDEFDGDEQQAASDLVEAMCERHQQHREDRADHCVPR